MQNRFVMHFLFNKKELKGREKDNNKCNSNSDFKNNNNSNNNLKTKINATKIIKEAIAGITKGS